jgi:hypothetical protein
MRLARSSHSGRYMQISICTNAAAAPMFTNYQRAFTRVAFGSQDRCRQVSRWRRSLRSESGFAFDQSRTLE